jgi:hypothetical protein
VQNNIAERQFELEERKFQFSVLLEAVKTGNPDAARANLAAFLNAGFLDDPSGKLRAYLEVQKPGEGPVLPLPK